LKNDTYDVVICGGGMAGLTMARHLQRQLPQLSVALVERTERPLPEAGFKVGESSIEGGSNYVGQVVGLHSYLRKKHLLKNGLRFFPGGSHLALNERPEIGPATLPLVPGYQIDRGVFEHDVREMVQKGGTNLLEGYAVEDCEISPTTQHEVRIRHHKTGETRTLKCRWLVDAAGRRFFLKTKLKLAQKWAHNLNASWFRVDGRLDINDFVVPHCKEWHNKRDRLNNRYFSTNHLMGHGYWVWLIPLGSGNTSVGIVAAEEHHPIANRNTYDLSLKWLQEHEPVVARHLEGVTPMDFLCFKDCSYGAKQVFSADRWACVGEAGVFVDPLYSYGLDFIAMSNSIAVELIRREINNKLTPADVDEFNNFHLTLANNVVELFNGSYHIFNVPRVLMAKLYWDLGYYWGFFALLLFFELYKRPELLRRLECMRNILALNLIMQTLFKDWARIASPEPTQAFTPYPPLFTYLSRYHGELWRNKSPLRAVRDIEKSVRMLEDVARVWFLRAVRDTMPERAATLDPSRINPYAISLDPQRWQKDGLFDTKPVKPHILIERDIQNYCGEIKLKGWSLAAHCVGFYRWNSQLSAKAAEALPASYFDPLKFHGRAISVGEWWQLFTRTQRSR
jgi:flavin-dependent dehydrogenase